MNNIEFSQILEQVCLEEYTAPDNAPVHHFSFRHRRNMRRILAMPFSCQEVETQPQDAVYTHRGNFSCTAHGIGRGVLYQHVYHERAQGQHTAVRF